MTTGSLCLTEILMSRKPCSSNSEHSHSADSTSASGVALPYFASSRLSSEPALTPMRIGTPASPAALAISATLSSNALMLPGLTRTAAQPASIAAKTYLGWKWMSAMTGICDCLAIAGSASASSWVGHGDAHDLAAGRGELGDLLQRRVDVGGQRRRHRLHRDRRVAADEHARRRRSAGSPPALASGWGGAAGMPSETVMTSRSAAFGRPRSSTEVDRVDDVGGEERARDNADEDAGPRRRSTGMQLVQCRPGPGRAAAPPAPAGCGPARSQDRDVAAVERQQRQQVEDADEEVQRRR